ncbi:ATP-binding protein [Sansalvadorimonas verongulae]|uniref:ATP-binding protein n=1 Tax=Sansalvadorimonas verongulae TaxID=2172824 RepID=UPI0012BB8E8C|nr:ATP-binding protein [Sansalvadorimonas verongulae]MTI13435.1 ATP-binding protein [Sansalvadorimonas verongulae]
MSNVNIQRAIDNIRAGSGVNIYTPVVEIIVNAIQAIEIANVKDGLVEIVVNREKQGDLDGSAGEVCGFTVSDNGIGFNTSNRNSFDTLYSDHKISQGGKGFGRFTCLKYFDTYTVESIYEEGGQYFCRCFQMGRQKDIIINESNTVTDRQLSGSTVRISTLRYTRFIDKQLFTIARVLVERLLPYFFDNGEGLPKVVLREEDESEVITLNSYLQGQGGELIQEVFKATGDFQLTAVDCEHQFFVKVFKFYSPREKTSKVSLVAHRREVTSTSLHKFIPEFVDEFCEGERDEISEVGKNFIIKVYVSGCYMDEHVSLERGGFEFQKDSDLNFGIAQTDIEKAAAAYAVKAVSEDVEARKEKKARRLKDYVESRAPWHKGLLKNINVADLAYNATEEQLESKLQSAKFHQEVKARRAVKKLLSSEGVDDLKSKASEIVQMVSDTSKNDLVHYIAMRRSVIDIFEKSLQMGSDGQYSSEGVVHDIIFPRKGNTDETPFDAHNLWLIDERLNFTEYLASDIPLRGNSDRPDLLAFDHSVVFRGENEPSNPVTVFEFKRPQRDDFINPSSNEDPVQQVIRYVRKIRDGVFKTPRGREIQIGSNTPFYGYVVCDLNKKVKVWLEEEKNFKPMPDQQGYFHWHDNLNLYTEVISWDKVLKDATMRNKIFFHQLNI